MGTITEKLAHLSASKADIKTAIEAHDIEVSDTLPLAGYGDKIREIKGGIEINAPIEEVAFPFDVAAGDVIGSRIDFPKQIIPDTPPGSPLADVAISLDGEYIAGTRPGTLVIYKKNGEFFTRLIVITLPGGAGDCCEFSPDGNYLAIGGYSALVIFKRNGDTFTQLANPAFPDSVIHGLSLSGDASYLAAALEDNPGVAIYKRNGETFTRLAAPSGFDQYRVRSCALSEDGTELALCSIGFNVAICRRTNGDNFTNVGIPSVRVGNGAGCAVSADGNVAAFCGTSSWCVIKKDARGTYVIHDNHPSEYANDITMSPDGSMVAIVQNAALKILEGKGNVFTPLKTWSFSGGGQKCSLSRSHVTWIGSQSPFIYASMQARDYFPLDRTKYPHALHIALTDGVLGDTVETNRIDI